jgi:membrane associated rhomboid family serine protease
MNSDIKPEQDDASFVKLRNTFEQLLPLADDLADALGVLLLIASGVIIWIFFYLFYLQGIAVLWALGLTAIALIPVLILWRFWNALESLQNIPDVAEELIDDVTEDVSQSWHAIKTGNCLKFVPY